MPCRQLGFKGMSNSVTNSPFDLWFSLLNYVENNVLGILNITMVQQATKEILFLTLDGWIFNFKKMSHLKGAS